MKTSILLSSMALLLAGTACGRRETQPDATPPPTRVHLVPNGEAPTSGFVAASLTATQRATLSTRIGASVKKVYVTEGQQVPAGALLVSLRDEDLQGGLRAAETAVATAKTQMLRIENLARQNAATSAEVDLASVQLAQAQAGLAAVKANIAYTQVRAPFAGVVQTRRVNDGDFVGPGMPLVEMEGQGALEFIGSVSEEEAKGLKIGQSLPFEVDGLSGTAQITGLATGGDPVSHRAALRARVVKGPKGLRTGAFGRLRLPGTPSQAVPDVDVPQSSLVQRGELRGVFVAKNGKAELRWLSLGEAQGGRWPVRAGLARGEQVIDSPGDLRDGQAVEVVK